MSYRSYFTLLTLTLGFNLVYPLQLFAAVSTEKLQPLDSIAAVVNKDIITSSQLNDAIKAYRLQLQSTGQTISTGALCKQTLDQLVDQKLQLQLASRNGITVSDQQVNQAIADIAKRNGLTMMALKDKLAEDGINYPKYYQQIREQMLVSQVRNTVLQGQINATPQELEDYIKQYQSDASHKLYQVEDILVPLPDSLSSDVIDATHKKAQDLLTSLQNSKDFNAAIRQLQATNLGWRNLADLPTTFAKTVSMMQQGEMAGPIQAANGFHILKLLGTRTDKGSLNTDQLRQALLQRKYDEAVQSWLQKLRQESYIQIKVDCK